MGLGNAGVIDRFDTVLCHGLDPRNETLRVEFAPIGRQQDPEPAGLVGVGEADARGETGHVGAADDKFVVRGAVITLPASLAVRQQPLAGGPALEIKPRDDTEAQQHPLNRLESCRVVLGEANADPLALISLHRSIGVEQAAQKAGVEPARSPLDCGCDRLSTRLQPEFEGESTNGGQCKPGFAASRNFDPTGEVRAVRQGARGRQGLLHDRQHARAFDLAVGHGSAWPRGQHGLVPLQGAVAQQQPDQIAFGLAMGAGPSRPGAVIVQQHLVPRRQIARLGPRRLEPSAGLAHDAPDRVLGRDAKAPALACRQA